MAEKIIITIDGTPFEAELDDTTTGRAIAEALPIESAMRTWGDEFYFVAGLGLERDETSATDVDVGDLGYWPDGDAICIFFGPTPASTGDKPVPASAVNKIGRLLSDTRTLKQLSNPRKVVLSKSK